MAVPRRYFIISFVFIVILLRNDFQDVKKSLYFATKITKLFMKIDRIYKRRDPFNLVYASAEAREYAIEKAEELQSTLVPHYPTLVKAMLPSHVSGGFWLVTKFNSFATSILFGFNSLCAICTVCSIR